MIRRNQAHNTVREGPCVRTERTPEILLEYCAGTLDAPAMAEFSRHIEACAGCRRAVEEQRGLWNVLDGWSPAEVPADFDERVYARIALEEAAPTWTKWWRRMVRPAVPYWFWKPALAMAAACAVLAIGFAVHEPKAADTSQQVRSENVDIEQVESVLEDLDMLSPVSQASTNPI